MARQTLLVTAALLAAALFLTACTPASPPRHTLLDNVTHGTSELIGSDVFAGSFTSTGTTVLGISVGAPDSQLLAKLGPADTQNEYDFGAVKNWEYGPSLGLNSTGVSYHIQNGFVTRISVFPALNKVLVGNATIGATTGDVYGLFGTPDRQYTIKGGRYFVYNTAGLELYLNKTNVVSYAFVVPNRKLPSTATLPQNLTNYTAPSIPRLLEDTTTLCDQGPTTGYNLGNNTCAPFATACAIPADWIEVKSCAPGNVTINALALDLSETS